MWVAGFTATLVGLYPPPPSLISDGFPAVETEPVDEEMPEVDDEEGVVLLRDLFIPLGLRETYATTPTKRMPMRATTTAAAVRDKPFSVSNVLLGGDFCLRLLLLELG